MVKQISIPFSRRLRLEFQLGLRLWHAGDDPQPTAAEKRASRLTHVAHEQRINQQLAAYREKLPRQTNLG